MFAILIHVVIIVAYTFSSSFWRQIEQLFRVVSDLNIDYLKQQVLCGICFSCVKNKFVTHLEMYFEQFFCSYMEILNHVNICK